jgi:hypothetical protein
MRYLKSVGRDGLPQQWHVEASTPRPSQDNWTVTVMRTYRKGQQADARPEVERTGTTTQIALRGRQVSVVVEGKGTGPAVVTAGSRQWRFTLAGDAVRSAK